MSDRRQQDTLEQERYEYEAGLLRADPAYFEWLDKQNRNTNMSTDLDSLVTSNSKYMKKEDVPEDGVDLTIKHFTKEVVKGDDGEEQKAAVHFVEDGYKPLLLNQTNIARIKAATGEKTVEGVKGKKVKVFCDPFVEFGGRMVGGVRIKKADPLPDRREARGGELNESDVPF